MSKQAKARRLPETEVVNPSHGERRVWVDMARKNALLAIASALVFGVGFGHVLQLVHRLLLDFRRLHPKTPSEAAPRRAT